MLSMAVIVLLSLGIVPIAKLAGSPQVYGNGGTLVVGYDSGQQFKLLAYSYNIYGQPVVGTQLNVTMNDALGHHSATASTNASGFAVMTVPSGHPGNQTFYFIRVAGQVVAEGSLPYSHSGQVFSLAGSPIGSVVDPANSSRSEALFFFQGPNGRVPSMYRIYYNFSASYGGPVTSAAGMTFLGSPTSYVSVFRLPEIPRSTPNVLLVAADANGTVEFESGFSSTGGPTEATTPLSVFSLFMSNILALVVPLMSILVAYNSYGKDRTTGVLESVLTRPVTRRSLGLTRYASFVIAISVALVVTMVAMEAISQFLLGDILPLNYAAYTVGAMAVEAAAFIGIVMVISQLTKSQGTMILASMGLWVVLDFLWTVLVFFVSAVLGVQVGSGNYLAVTIQSSFFNPAQFYSLIGVYIEGITTVGSVPISPATYGLTPLTLALDASFWVFVPLFAFLYLVSRRD